MTTTATTIEAELRHAVIDRLIAASLRNAAPAREAELKVWRTIATRVAVPGRAYLPPDLTHL